jgi:hypothetical protein
MNTTVELQALADKGHGCADSFKRPIADLKHRGFIVTKQGSAGGSWLTPAGREFIQQARQL